MDRRGLLALLVLNDALRHHVPLETLTEQQTIRFYASSRCRRYDITCAVIYVRAAYFLFILDDDMTDEDDPFYEDKVSKRLINGSSEKKARVRRVL